MGLLAAVSTSDALVFLVVVGARLVLPLFIPRFPLPAVLACLVLDAADQSIFQKNTDLDLSGYQSYDKALDIYYLTLAYLAVVRNWGSPTLLAIGAFLWYYRLVGVVLFELSGVRAILVIFPNTFEYYFIAIEAIRSGWNTNRLSHRAPFLIAAGIWIFIKLPQEYWIHVAQLDTTDLIKEKLFGVDPTTSWGDAFANRPWMVALIIGVFIALALVVWALVRRLPPRDWPLTFRADTVNEHLGWLPGRGPAPETAPFGRLLVEKIVLAGLVSMIFYMILPGSAASNLQVFLVIGLAVVAMAALGLLVRRYQRQPSGDDADASLLNGSFALTIVMNLAISASALWFFANLVSDDSERVRLADIGFFAVLVTIIVTLFDYYRQRRAWAELV